MSGLDIWLVPYIWGRDTSFGGNVDFELFFKSTPSVGKRLFKKKDLRYVRAICFIVVICIG